LADSQNIFPLKRSQFSCPKCKGQEGSGAFFFFAPAEAIIQNEHGEYVAACPQCGEAGAELWYMRNVRLTIGKKTGPVTEAGKAKCAMNPYLTGSSYATGAIPRNVPPAKPGKYAECESCQDLADCKDEVERAKGTCRYVACHRISEVIAKYRNAHLTGDPESLRLQAADNQANMQRVMNQCFKAIFDNDVYIESVVVSNGQPVYVLDGEKAVPLTEKKINPAINESIKILEKMGFGLADWTLTPKSKEAKAAFEGYLAGRAAEKGVSADEFLEQHKKDMQAMHAALERGNAAMQNDETLQEAQAEEQSDPETKDA
jgi:hypothetical protein